MLVIFGIATADLHAVTHSPSGRADVRGAQLGGRGRSVGDQVGPTEGPALRVLRRDRRVRRRVPRDADVHLHRQERAAVRHAVLARARRDVRHPPTRRRAARRAWRWRARPRSSTGSRPTSSRRARSPTWSARPTSCRSSPASGRSTRAGARRRSSRSPASNAWRNDGRRNAPRRSRPPRPSVHGGVVPEHEQRVHAPPAGPPAAPTRVEGAALALDHVVAGYGDVEVLHGVSLGIAPRHDRRAARRQRRRQVDVLRGRERSRGAL